MSPNQTILIIEDDFMVRDTIVTILECEQFEVIEASEGTEGIQLANQYLPDLILCDIMMPNLSGYEVLKQLGAQTKTATIPFVFISAKTQKIDIRSGMELGADDYITKPFTRDELISAVKTRLKKQASRQTYYDQKIDRLEEKIQQLERKLNQLIQTNSSQIFEPTQGWQGRFNQVIMTADQINTLTTEMNRALERDEFQLYYQPQVNLNTQKIVGAEALLRWQHPTRGMVSPAEFIPVAEAKGLISPIGEWVIKTVCQQAKKWENMNFDLNRFGVNVAAQQLQHSDFGDKLLKTLIEAQLTPDSLELELTESSLVQNIQETRTIFQNLKNLGVQLAIDDFGTGYSALSYLTNFDFDVLKIDRAFVQDIDKSFKKQAVVQLMIELAHTLNLKVLAEGVETEAELAILKQLDCDEFQGYLFSRPLPVADMEALLVNHSKASK